MEYQRKTEDEYQLIWDYGCGNEVISCCSTYREAKNDQMAYITNEGICPVIKKHRVPKKEA